ncbi:DUF4286 family protein [Paraburkholderia sp. J67]|uniref:DUF4286 family protein n=1 Tax=Paraburkholderia sp. J67 TaxID=2805435 RepID=UPI002ABD7B54|nr:DUF4286 family protein [Paraburkholderia sp. J67]
MALSGSAFLALWNDVDADVEADYERWHTIEHVPERVGIPGFLAGRRYRSDGADAASQARYFTLYEVWDASVFESAAYRDVIDHPTPWSATMRPRLRNVMRATCEAAGSLAGQGAHSVVGDANAIACARFFCAPHAAPQIQPLLNACASLTGIRAVYLGATHDSVPQAFQQWSKGAAPSHVLLIEGDDEAVLRAARADIARAIATHAPSSEPATIDIYTLAFRIEHAQVDDSLRRAASAPFSIDAHSEHSGH